MQAKYIPPHARAQNGTVSSSSNTAKPTDTISSEKGPNHRSRQDESLSPRHEGTYRWAEIHRYFWPSHKPDYETRCNGHDSGTLNDSETRPRILEHVILFNGEHPWWESQNTVFVNLNLRLLGFLFKNSDLYADSELEIPYSIAGLGAPKAKGFSVAETDETLMSTTDMLLLNSFNRSYEDRKKHQRETREIAQACLEPKRYSIRGPRNEPPTIHTTSRVKPRYPRRQPIPVFQEVEPIRHKAERRFKYIGYHRVTKMQWLDAQSVDLVRMLQQKWSEPLELPRAPKIVTEGGCEEVVWSQRSILESPEWAKELSVPWVVVQLKPLSSEEESELGLLPPRIKWWKKNKSYGDSENPGDFKVEGDSGDAQTKAGSRDQWANMDRRGSGGQRDSSAGDIQTSPGPRSEGANETLKDFQKSSEPGNVSGNSRPWSHTANERLGDWSREDDWRNVQPRPGSMSKRVNELLQEMRESGQSGNVQTKPSFHDRQVNDKLRYLRRGSD